MVNILWAGNPILGLVYTRSQVLSSKYDMDAYMATHFVVRLKTCVDSWDEQKSRPNSQHKSR